MSERRWGDLGRGVNARWGDVTGSPRPMVNVLVKLYGDLKPRSGEGEIGLALGAGSTIDDALQALVAEKPELVELLFGVQGGVRETVNVFLNGVNARGLPADQAVLRDGDTLFIVTAFGGG